MRRFMISLAIAGLLALGFASANAPAAKAATLAFNNVPGPSDPASELNFVSSQIGDYGVIDVLGKINFGPTQAGLYSSDPGDSSAVGLITDVGANVQGVVEFILSSVTADGGKITAFDLTLQKPVVYDLVAVWVKAGRGGTIWYDGEFDGISVLNTVGKKGNIPDISHLTFFGGVIPVPVPGSLALLITAMAGLAFVSHRRRKMQH